MHLCACGAEVPYQGSGKPREYCSRDCKRASKNERVRNRRAVAAATSRAQRLAAKTERVAALTTHTCRKCNTEKPVSEFQPNTRFANGYVNWCKTCYADYRRGRRDIQRRQERFSKYGITPDEQVALFVRQGARCAACEDEITEGTAHLDHCHTTRRIRGFLCMPCNIAFGSALEDPDRLLKLAQYAQRQWEVAA